MNEAKQAIQFARPRDGSERDTLTDAEKLAAAVQFKDITDGLLLQFADATKVYDHTILRDSLVAHLSLKVDQNDGSWVSVFVESYTKDSGENTCQVEVQENDVSGLGREYHRYYSNGDEVRRFDRDDTHERVPAYPQEEIDFSGPASDVITALEGRIKSWENEEENRKLAQDMGLNDQLVGPDEVQQLAALAANVEPHKI